MLDDASSERLEKKNPQENEDYYYNEKGLFVFTEKYHLKRGYCCKNECLHCPWNYLKSSEDKKFKKKESNK